MLTFGIILCYLLGLSILFLMSRKYSLLELAGYSFLIGIGAETFFLFLLDIFGIKFSAGILIGINVFFIIALLGINFKNILLLKNELNFKIGLKDVNFAAVFIFCFIAYLFYAITVKNLFWPPTEHDVIGSFDKLGRIMASEGKLKISLFDYNLEGAGGIYPPLYHGSFCYVYLFGAQMPKIITTLFFTSTLLSFYSLAKNYAGATAAALFTLLFMITPEFFSHAALSLGNLPTTAYVGTAALATITWLDKRDEKYFWLGAIMMGLTLWVRSDTIVFLVAAFLLLGIDFVQKREWKKPLIYSAIATAPFVLWTFYLKLKIANVPSGKFNFGIGFNSERLSKVWDYVSAYLFGGMHGNVDGGQLFGVAFILFFVVALINMALLYKTGIKNAMKDLNVLIFFFVSLGLYVLVFYFIDEKAQNAPLYSLMESSFKRGMFFFLPVAMFYTATSHASVWLFEKIEKFRKNEQ